jgi:hypothetical protein
MVHTKNNRIFIMEDEKKTTTPEIRCVPPFFDLAMCDIEVASWPIEHCSVVLGARAIQREKGNSTRSRELRMLIFSLPRSTHLLRPPTLSPPTLSPPTCLALHATDLLVPVGAHSAASLQELSFASRFDESILPLVILRNMNRGWSFNCYRLLRT